ncbi:MAG: alpha-2-macroglobulin family protein [Gammaproteobacteria bacterium]
MSFSAPVAAQTAQRIRLAGAQGETYPFQTLDPATKPWIEDLEFSGPFPPRAALRVELPPELTDDTGRKLSNAARFPLEVKTDEYPPLAKFSGEFGIIEWKEGGILPVTVRNIEPGLALQRLLPAREAVNARMQRIEEGDAAIPRWIRRVAKAMASRGKWQKTAAGEDTYVEMTGNRSVFSKSPAAESFTLPRAEGAGEFEVLGIPLGKPGFYVVELASPKLGAALLGRAETRYVATTALVTNLAVHFKWGREGSLAWVTTLDAAQPVTKAAIAISDYCSGQTLWRGETGEDGAVQVPAGILPEPHGSSGCSKWNRPPLFVSARTESDMSFALSGWNNGIQPYHFELDTGSYYGSMVAHAVLDRSLFRAGETAAMKLFFRQRVSAGLVLPAEQAPQLIRIAHQGSDQQYELPLALDANGIGEASWAIPKDVKLGVYRISLTHRGSGPSYEAGDLRVEQFRIPSMKAVIQGRNKPLVQAKQLTVDLFVSYLSGGGAALLPVKLRSMVVPRVTHFPDYAEYRFEAETVVEGLASDEYRPYTESQPRPAAQVLPLTLDKSGAGRATIPDLPAVTTPHEVVAELEYYDQNGEILTAANRFPLAPAEIHLGLRTDGWVATKDSLRLRAVVLDLAGKPRADRPVTMELFERKTYSYRRRLVGGFYAYDNKTETKKLSAGCAGRSDALGFVACEVQPRTSGNVIIRASGQDALGNTVQATRDVWVAGGDDWWFEGGASDRMDLLPERKDYESGEVARLQVRMPFRAATALVTVEREGVLDRYVTALSGKEPVIEVPIKPSYAPNAYVSVLAVRGRVGAVRTWLADNTRGLDLPWKPEGGAPTTLIDLSKPAFKLGMAAIRVGWAPFRLKVRVHPDAEVYKVRDRARVEIEVTPPDGAALPAGAEVAVAAVDEGLLELRPNDSWDLLAKMMGLRGIEVYTASAQMQVVGKRHYGRKAVPAGGGGGQQGARELFDTLLLWKGRLPLDGQGRASIEVPLNDALTAFRIVAVAHAGAQLFGTGQATIRSTQDLMLHAGLPPLVREGDRFNAAYTIRNASKGALKIQAQGHWSTERTPGTPHALPAQVLTLEAGQAQAIHWEIEVPVDQGDLRWEIEAASEGGAARDRLKVGQTVIPAHPVRVYQATLTQIDQPFEAEVDRPAGAILARGGVAVQLRARLGDGLSGVQEYMSHYPYTCLEQRVSRAVSLRDDKLWAATMGDLPSYLDSDGLLKYFPSASLQGSDVLSSYVLAIAHESGRPIPEGPLARIQQALRGFVEGRLSRESVPHGADLTVRKLAALEALSRHGEARHELLGSLTIDPALWPTSALLDWIAILQRVADIPERTARLAQAQQLLRARLNFQGTTMGFSGADDALWWLMVSTDVNAVRAILAVLDQPLWRVDLPRMARGALGRQRKGHWDTTTANAWGVVAMERFSQRFESEPVTGATTVRLATMEETRLWKDEARALQLPWPEVASRLSVTHTGTGRPWAFIESRAALPLREPYSSGFKIERSVAPIEQHVSGRWSRGDVARVSLQLEAQADMGWVVVDDPIPAGSSVLGTGLGRDSELLTQGERREGWVWPAYEERRYDAFRAYYQWVPKGRWQVEYTVRLNAAGEFKLPATRVEALYAPEMLGEVPNEVMLVYEPE